MKNILLLTILLFIYSSQLFGQENSVCPAIKMISPEKMAKVDGIMIFSLSSEQLNNKDLEYKWGISAGKIVLGQGTTGIAVEMNPDLEGITVTATVEIKGLPEKCKSEFLGNGEVEVNQRPQIGHPLNRYEKLQWSDERNRLEGVFMDLRSDPTATGYLIFQIKDDSDMKSVLERQKKILKSLRQSKISQCRLVFKIVKSGIYQTTHWIIPQGVEFPQ